MPTSRNNDPFHDLCGDDPSPPWGVQLHISAAKEAGDVTGLTSKNPKISQQVPKRFICNDSSFAFNTYILLKSFPSILLPKL